MRQLGTRANTAAPLAAGISVLIGLLVLVGWATSTLALTSFIPGHFAAQPLTAAGLILGGAALLALAQPGGRRSGAIAAIALLLLFTLTLISLFEHITGVDLKIGNLLFSRSLALQLESYVHPGRTSVPAAVAFLLIATSFCLVRIRGRVAGLICSATSTMALVLVGTALLAHLFEAEQFAGPLAFTLVAMPTAIGLGSLAVGALALRTDAGWVRLVAGQSVGASVARRLLPAVIAIPVAVAWLAYLGSELGIYSPNLRLSLVTSLTVVLLATFAVWSGKQLNRLAAVQRTADALRESEARTKAAEERQRTLAHELNHRVKNNLMVVQALARQSFRGTGVPREALSTFEARLSGLAAAHDLLIGRGWQEAPMREVVARALESACGAQGDRIECLGADLELSSTASVALSMMIHELCTNAFKYGALSNEAGRVAIRWTVEPGHPRRLHMEWTETGGPSSLRPRSGDLARSSSSSRLPRN